MAAQRCSDVVRIGGDLGLAPGQEQEPLAAHLATCADCASYVDQMITTRDLLQRDRNRPLEPTHLTVSAQSTESTWADAATLRTSLLQRAQLLDASTAEDLTQQALEVGIALQRDDHKPRGLAELTSTLHALADAQARSGDPATPAVDVNVAARAKADMLEGLDSDADESELFYPELYADDDPLDGWVASPNEWRGGAHILGPEEVDETGELYEVLDQALSELPEPLGTLVALVDVQDQALRDAAEIVGLDDRSAGAALARARNHVRGRLNEYLTGNAVGDTVGRP